MNKKRIPRFHFFFMNYQRFILAPNKKSFSRPRPDLYRGLSADNANLIRLILRTFQSINNSVSWGLSSLIILLFSPAVTIEEFRVSVLCISVAVVSNLRVWRDRRNSCRAERACILLDQRPSGPNGHPLGKLLSEPRNRICSCAPCPDCKPVK